ncbi:MAG: magnesium transporter CorA family protein [Akkermansia sp.]
MIRLYRQTSNGIDRTTHVGADTDVDAQSVFWIDLLTPTPDEIRFAESLVSVEMPTYDEMREIEATSRLYTEDGARFMTTTVLSRVNTETPILSEISFILCGPRIVTIRHSDSYSFRIFSHQLLRKTEITRDQVFIGLLETIVDRQADVLERFGSDLDRLSKTIFAKESSELLRPKKKSPETNGLRLVLQDLGRIGDLLTRQRDCLVNLLRLLTYASNEGAYDDSSANLYVKLRPLSRDVSSLSEYASFLSGNVNFMLDAVLGLINIEQNEIVKIFTVAAVIFMPPTLIASVYGMNFRNMPELNSEYGYFAALFFMAVSIVLPLVYFRSKRLI